MKKHSNSNTRYLLLFAAFVLGVISIYFTGEGFKIILGVEKVSDIIIAWGFAMAIGAILIYCSLNIGNYVNNNNYIPLIVVFTLFALLSLFFNFNSIYGKFTSDDLLIQNVDRLKSKIQVTRTTTQNAFDTLFQVSYYAQKLDSLQKELKREEKDRERPGRGIIYRSISLQIPPIEAEYNARKTKLKESLTPIRKLLNASEKYLDEQNKEIYKDNFLSAIQKYNESIAIANSLIPSLQFKNFTFEEDSKRPDYALQLLIRFITFDDTLKNSELSYILLSLFIGFLIDFPVFIAFFILDLSKNSKNKTPKNIFRENNANSFSEPSKRKRNGNKKITWD